MKRFLAAILTVGLMIPLFWAGLRRRAGDSLPSAPSREAADSLDSPEAIVKTLLTSAQHGDIAAYRETFAGKLRDRVEREIQDSGPERFAEQLRRASAARKSHAIFSSQPDGQNAVHVTVESVYPDRNERQTYRLEQHPDGWRITSVDSLVAQMPRARYGTLAGYQEPEGVPVQDGASAGASRPSSPSQDTIEDSP